jgi:c(7)-type cytochrome triheme protein
MVALAAPSALAQQAGSAAKTTSAGPINLKSLPKARFGDGINWVQALHENKISPAADVNGQQQPSIFDLDIVMPVQGSMESVIFSHKVHTEWLGCSSCHPALFEAQKGANPITMAKVAQGQYCGACHGKVAFPLAECKRCHSVPKKN